LEGALTNLTGTLTNLTGTLTNLTGAVDISMQFLNVSNICE
jgi:hypothetical protein